MTISLDYILDVGTNSRNSERLEAGRLYINSYSANQVDECCTPGHYTIQMQASSTGAIGAKAHIETHDLEFCGSPDSNTASQTLVYVNVMKPNPSAEYGIDWAQTGYTTIRYDKYDIVRRAYAEINGNEYQMIFDTDINLLNNASEHYACSLSVSTGYWHFFFNGENIYLDEVESPMPDSHWIDTFGTRASWAAETYHFENDIPGNYTDPNPCEFNDCCIIGTDGIEYFDKTKAVLDNNGYPDEWGILWSQYNDNSFYIWDKNKQSDEY